MGHESTRHASLPRLSSDVGSSPRLKSVSRCASPIFKLTCLTVWMSEFARRNPFDIVAEHKPARIILDARPFAALTSFNPVEWTVRFLTAWNMIKHNLQFHASMTMIADARV